MTDNTYKTYLEILCEELVPAMGCTEPIALAYATALAKKHLGFPVDSVRVGASANIIKNVKSVVVPNTGGKQGIAAAVAAGAISGDAERELQVLSAITPDKYKKITEFIANTPIEISASARPYIFSIIIELCGSGHTASCEIAGHHTNVISIKKDGELLFSKPYEEKAAEPKSRYTLTVEDIVDFADNVGIEDVRDIIERQIEYNTAIANEGLTGKWGAAIGKTILEAYGEGVQNKAKAYAAAGSDARMNGCEMPVIINSGSGNQGMTASLPVIAYAEHLGSTKEELIRALVVSNLITIHMKTDIGRLSAYCGATSAGCGAGAGICYLYGGKAEEISHTVVNSVAINSGMICDGAKASCAAKIASAVEAGLLGFQMQQRNREFFGGEGIVTKGVENTIKNVGRVARLGMAETDREIIRIMTDEK